MTGKHIYVFLISSCAKYAPFIECIDFLAEHALITHSIPCVSGERCIVDYFSKYLDALGNSVKFYRRALPGTDENAVRFSSQIVGINKLKTFMKVICDAGGLKGNFTNHSGKRTCATQLYMSGVEEQEIMARTGHRSTDGVRKYKRASAEMMASVSSALDPPPAKKLRSHDDGDDECNMKMDSNSSTIVTSDGPSPTQRPDISEHAVYNNCTFNF
jgi:hypothetical protein